MVATGKRPLAVGANVGLSACVLAMMTCKLVGARKSPCATFPRALVWFFAWGKEREKKIQNVEI